MRKNLFEYDKFISLLVALSDESFAFQRSSEFLEWSARSIDVQDCNTPSRYLVHVFGAR